MKTLTNYIKEGLLDNFDDLEQEADNKVKDLLLSNNYKIWQVNVYESNQIARYISSSLTRGIKTPEYDIDEVFDEYVEGVNPIRAKKIAAVVEYLMNLPISDDLLKKGKYDTFNEIDMSEVVKTKVYLYLDDYDERTKDIQLQLRIGEGSIKILLEKK
jgi:hypothetical protein